MRLYNTPARQVEEFTPKSDKTVSLYTCGPTVYDYPHIGNWFTFVRYDILSRTLRASGYSVTWVMNITDVGHLVSDADDGEDKLEKGAKREGKTAWEIAKYYGDYFINGLTRLNFLPPEQIPKATDHIEEQVSLVSVLESKGYTYKIDDGIYFNTAKFTDYAKFAKLDLKELQAGARVENNPQKKSPFDFALWKFSPKDSKRDMEWDSPWGKGFPGWHLECSAMAMKYLGETIDIHGGGTDHIPIHHTNEIAQSQAATGKLFARFWVHSNFILVDGKKMSKSLGNFYTLEDIEKHGFSAMDFRLLILESNYRNESEFSWDVMQAAHNRLQGIYAMADMQFQTSEKSPKQPKDYFSKRYEDVLSALQDDLNTSVALRIINEVASQIEVDGLHPDDLSEFTKFLDNTEQLLGLKLTSRSDIAKNEKDMLTMRQKARDEKNWEHADQLRDKLLRSSIVINDTARGQIWSRII